MLYVLVAEGPDPKTARPIVVCGDPVVVHVVGLAIADRLTPRPGRKRERRESPKVDGRPQVAESATCEHTGQDGDGR